MKVRTAITTRIYALTGLCENVEFSTASEGLRDDCDPNYTDDTQLESANLWIGAASN